MKNWKETIINRLHVIYNESISNKQVQRLIHLIENSIIKNTNPQVRWSEDDIVLITYGDSILKKDEIPLITLKHFMDDYLQGKINILHILPFFPYSSDDGFSIIDFKQVNPELGNWEHIQEISKQYRLMSDLVINHISSKNAWFRNFLEGEGFGHDFVLTESPETDLTAVTRPRNTPLLTPYQTCKGTQYVWTTFSDDQIDLDYKNPEVLIAMMEILLFYIKNGIKIIRLDAIAFLWKEVGTTCLHQPKTHEIVRLMRNITDVVDPEVIILTETNVPNHENLSYFGHSDEAHMVYQFSLPPLLLHALNFGNGHFLTQWAQTIPELPHDCTFFNFTSSHDGIGVRPLEGLLPDHEKEQLYANIKQAGGLISMKTNKNGTTSPYELNITYYDAMKLTYKGADQWQNERFICSQTIMLALKGIPAFYIHSLLASPNYNTGVKETHRARTINREKLNKQNLYTQLIEDTNRHYVFMHLIKLIEIRKQQKAFHPSALQKVIDINSALFVLFRKNEGHELLSISNLTNTTQSITIPDQFNRLNFDLITDQIFSAMVLTPYQSLWLVKR